MGMRSYDKAEMLKSAIKHLYSNEGHSISYISKLLEINRKTLSSKIIEWKLSEPEPRHHFTPSMKKFVNKNRQLIKSRLYSDIPITKIADEINISRHSLVKTIIPNDAILKKAHEDYINRQKANHDNRIQSLKEQSFLEYDFDDLPDELWHPILGYEGYMVSNMGRVKHYSSRYKAYHLVKDSPNKNNGRLYIMLHKKDKRKNLLLARVVGQTFVDGYSDSKCTINHIDGDINNNTAANLEWVTQSENNTHSYRELNRVKNSKKRYKFSKIVYKDRYEFKTVAAFARFIGKSETQTRRYLDEPSKHDIKLVK